MKIRFLTGCLSMLLALNLFVMASPGFSEDDSPASDPTPPLQALDGPGGSNYSHAGVRQTGYGSGSHEFWIFEPADPTPASAPVIVFNHGWGAMFPVFYRAWVEHLVKRGNIVIYPRYQLTLNIGVRHATEHAIRSVQEAIPILQNGPVQPELENFAITGHSLGGGITAEMAVLAQENNLPIPKAVMPVQPYLRNDTMMNDFNQMPATVLLLVVVGEDDTIAGDSSARTIFSTAVQIPASQKNYVVQTTDRYGYPDLVADHMAPLCVPDTDLVDAMDFYSTWKLFDGLTDYAFYSINREYCLGNTPEQRFMGFWSDGTPVKELLVIDP